MEVGNLSIPISADLGPLERELSRVQGLLGDFEHKAEGATRQIDEMARSSNAAGGAIMRFAKQLAGVFAVRELIRFTDTWTDLTSRVNLAAGSVEKGTAVMSRLNDMARTTYSSLELTTETYIRNAGTLRDLGKSTAETLDYTEALNNALVVSGARGDRAARVQDALGKAMALGKLSGDQLNTVIESGGRVAEVLAERMGTTVSNLRTLGAEGKITGDIIFESLVGNMEKLSEEAESMPATIGDAFQLLSNSILQVIGQFDHATETSGTLAQAMIFVADNMQRVITYIATGAVAWGGYTAAIALANAGMFTATGLLAALRAGLLRLGIGAIVVALGELAYQFVKLVERTGGLANAFTLLGEVAEGVWEGIVISAGAIPVGLQSVWAEIQSSFARMIGQMAEIWNSFLATFEAPALTVTIGGTTHELIGGLDLSAWKADVGAATQAAAEFSDQAAGLRDEASRLANEGFNKAGEALARLNEQMEESPMIDLGGDAGENRVAAGAGAGGGKKGGGKSKAQKDAERLAEAYQDLIRDSKAFIEQQEMERQAIGLTEIEAAKLRAEFDLLNQARRAGIDLTPAQIAELKNLAGAMAEAELATAKLRESYDFAKDTFKGFFTDMKNELQNGASIWEAFGTAAANALQKIADRALDMALNGIFDMLFSAFGGGGGFLGGLFRGFATGTNYAPGGWAMVGERGPELVNLPGGAEVVPNNRVVAPAAASFGGAGSASGGKVAIEVFVKDDGKIGAIARQEAGSMVEVAIRDYDTNQLPQSVERVSQHPRMR